MAPTSTSTPVAGGDDRRTVRVGLAGEGPPRSGNGVAGDSTTWGGAQPGVNETIARANTR